MQTGDPSSTVLPSSTVVAPGLFSLDLEFLGIARAQATAVISAAGSVALIDPGPATCLERLESCLRARGLQLGDVTDILITHVHLDHAGATGTLVRRYPHIRVYVHERGAQHLIRPTKLIDSATRFFGAANMHRFWGEIAVVPEDRLILLRGGERIEAGGRTLDVAYTPGHAVHHVSYFEPSTGIAFVGDTGGLCIHGGYILAATPPPDVELEAWTDSVDRILAWQPRALFLAHFGPVDHPQVHLQTLLANLRWMSVFVKASLDEPGTDEERSHSLGAALRKEIRRAQSGVDTAAYEPTAPLESLWYGLARYWRKRSERT